MPHQLGSVRPFLRSGVNGCYVFRLDAEAALLRLHASAAAGVADADGTEIVMLRPPPYGWYQPEMPVLDPAVVGPLVRAWCETLARSQLCTSAITLTEPGKGKGKGRAARVSLVASSNALVEYLRACGCLLAAVRVAAVSLAVTTHDDDEVCTVADVVVYMRAHLCTYVCVCAIALHGVLHRCCLYGVFVLVAVERTLNRRTVFAFH